MTSQIRREGARASERPPLDHHLGVAGRRRESNRFCVFAARRAVRWLAGSLYEGRDSLSRSLSRSRSLSLSLAPLSLESLIRISLIISFISRRGRARAPACLLCSPRARFRDAQEMLAARMLERSPTSEQLRKKLATRRAARRVVSWAGAQYARRPECTDRSRADACAGTDDKSKLIFYSNAPPPAVRSAGRPTERQGVGYIIGVQLAAGCPGHRSRAKDSLKQKIHRETRALVFARCRWAGRHRMGVTLAAGR